MTARTLGINDARGKLGDLVTAAARRGEITVITSHRIPAAAIVPLDALRDEYREQADAAISATGEES